MKKRESQNVKAYRRQMKKADHDYHPGVYTYNFEVARVDGEEMGPFETKYETMKKSLLIFTVRCARSVVQQVPCRISN